MTPQRRLVFFFDAAPPFSKFHLAINAQHLRHLFPKVGVLFIVPHVRFNFVLVEILHRARLEGTCPSRCPCSRAWSEAASSTVQADSRAFAFLARSISTRRIPSERQLTACRHAAMTFTAPFWDTI
jgi:hypothetical protein